MKKIIFIIVFVAGGLLSSNISNAQAFEEGASSIQAGYGFGNFIQAVFSTYEDELNYSFSSTGPAFIKYEYAVSDKMGFGLNIAYAAANVSYTDGVVVGTTTPFVQTIKWNTVSALARMNLHFGSSDKFDPYWGLGFGYRTASWKYEDNDPNYDNTTLSAGSLVPIGFETTIGARIYFTDNFGLYFETGLAKAIFQGGLSVKF